MNQTTIEKRNLKCEFQTNKHNYLRKSGKPNDCCSNQATPQSGPLSPPQPDHHAPAPNRSGDSMNKPNKMWFQGQMYEQHLSARKLASRIGIDPSAMSNMLNGKRALKSEEAAKLAEIFNVTTDEVLSQAGVSVHQRPAGEASTAVGGSSVRPQRPTKVQHAGQRLISVPLPSGKTIAIEFEEGTSLEEWRLASRFIEGFF